MKLVSILIFITALSLGLGLTANLGFGGFNFSGGSVKGSGNAVTEKRDLRDFRQIQAGGAVNVETSVGGDFAVAVTADDNILEKIKTEVNGDTLKISCDGKISPKTAVTIKISLPELDGLELSGASAANVNGVKSAELEIEASGASKISISGAAENLDLKASGASEIEAGELKNTNAEINVSGASEARVTASNSLKIKASGASSVEYSGEPQTLSKKISGASSVKQSD